MYRQCVFLCFILLTIVGAQYQGILRDVPPQEGILREPTPQQGTLKQVPPQQGILRAPSEGFLVGRAVAEKVEDVGEPSQRTPDDQEIEESGERYH